MVVIWEGVENFGSKMVKNGEFWGELRVMNPRSNLLGNGPKRLFVTELSDLGGKTVKNRDGKNFQNFRK